MQEQFDIVGFGICAVDFVGLVSHYPDAGEKVAIEAFSKQGGGNTGTALTTAARLGAKTAYTGKLGGDEYSQFLLNEFDNEGVNIKHVIIEDGAQPHISFIHVDKGTGERRISRYWKGFKITAEDLNRSVIQKSKILFLDHYYTEAGLAAANWIKASGGTVVVDAERPVAEFEPILTLADYLIASRKFAESETGTTEKIVHVLSAGSMVLCTTS